MREASSCKIGWSRQNIVISKVKTATFFFSFGKFSYFTLLFCAFLIVGFSFSATALKVE